MDNKQWKKILHENTLNEANEVVNWDAIPERKKWNIPALKKLVKKHSGKFTRNWIVDHSGTKRKTKVKLKKAYTIESLLNEMAGWDITYLLYLAPDISKGKNNG